MKPVQKEIYLDILSHLEPYGFRMYKGKIWKYDPAIGYVVCVKVELTRWGTLNEILVGASSYLAPIKQNNFSAKKEPLPATWLFTDSLNRRRGGGSMFAMGSPFQAVDITLRQQYDALRPFLINNVFPLLAFGEDKKSCLQGLEKIQNKACEAFAGIEAVGDMSLALEYYQLNDIENALRIIDLYTVYCNKEIEVIETGSKYLPSDRKQKIIGFWEEEKKSVMDFAEKIKSDPETIRRMIDENKAISENNCQQFFTSRFFSKKA